MGDITFSDIQRKIKDLHDLTDKNMRLLSDAYEYADAGLIAKETHSKIKVGESFQLGEGANIICFHKTEKVIMYIVNWEADYWTNKHYHDFTEEFKIIQGCLEVIFENENIKLRPGENLKIEPYKIHSVTADEYTVFITTINLEI